MAAAILFLSSVAQPLRLLSRPHPFQAACSKLSEQESRCLPQLRAMSSRVDTKGVSLRGRTQGPRPFERRLGLFVDRLRPASFAEGLRGVHLPRSAKVEAGLGVIAPEVCSMHALPEAARVLFPAAST